MKSTDDDASKMRAASKSGIVKDSRPRLVKNNKPGASLVNVPGFELSSAMLRADAPPTA